MAATADTNIGFKGQVTSANTPLIFGRPARYSVEGAGDLKVTKGGTGTWAVTVAAGTAWGDGVLSTWNGSTNLNGTSVSTGDRWDTLVVRRTWQPSSTPTGTSVLMLLAGGSSKALASSRTTDAGNTTSDQPIALVRFTAGQTAAQEVVDLRCWARDGGLYAADPLAQQYLTDPGTQFITGTTLYSRVVGSTGIAGWQTFELGRLSAIRQPTNTVGAVQLLSTDSATTGLALTLDSGGGLAYLRKDNVTVFAVDGNGKLTTGTVPATSVTGTPGGVRRGGSALNIANNNDTAYSFPSGDSDLTGGVTISASGLKVPVSGWYAITASMNWTANGNGIRVARISINDADTSIANDSKDAAGAGGAGQNLAAVTRLAAGDTVKLYVRQTSRGTLASAPSGASLPRLGVVWIGA